MTRSPASPPSERRRFVVIGLGGLAGLAPPSAADDTRRLPDPLDKEEAARVLKALKARSSLKPG